MNVSIRACAISFFSRFDHKNCRQKIGKNSTLTIFGLLLVMCAVTPASAVDRSACERDLSQLARAAEVAADAADAVESKTDDLESAEKSLARCLSAGGDCAGEKSDYKALLSDLDSAKRNLKQRLDAIPSHIPSVEASCKQDLGGRR